MTMQPGTTLLHYTLTDRIGEGGMGVVWKAVDTTLDRAVAIKILPETVAADAVGLARFEREAKLLASLSHPNIATIHGLHETGGIRFLAMELIDGEDLSKVLARGALPVDEALRIATRVAEALETAHDNGIVHRDLKPANVALTTEGAVKVLDFGLAKALEPEATDHGRPELSPTVTSAATAAGMIMGTAGYMSPEQARGQVVDARADVWALGCLIYEMLTGNRAYEGKTISDTLASVLRADPDWDALPATVPAGLIRVMRRCLVKDARDRVRHAGDVRLDLADLFRDEERPAESGGPSRGLPVALTVVAVLALALASWGWLRPQPEVDVGEPVRFEVIAGTREAPIESWSLSVSPDGRRIAWVVKESATASIHLREIDALESRRLPDTEGASRPAFSPGGQSIAFFAGGKLKRLDLESRAAIDLCDAVEGAGITWGSDGNIVFNSGWIAGLSRVSAEGGTPEEVTRLDEQDGEIGHWHPHLLPDNKHVLVSRWRTGLEDISVGVASLETGETRDLVPRASFARYVATGHLLFTRAGAVHVVPFDPERLEVTGDPVKLIDSVEQQWSSGSSTWAVSDTGVLAYLSGGLWSTKREVVRISRDGTVESLNVEPGAYLSVSISPDGGLLGLTQFDSGKTNVRIRDLARGVDTRLPPGTVNNWPLWGPDSHEFVFTTAREGPWDIYKVPVDQSAEPEMLVQGNPDQIPMAWSKDGRYLIFQEAYSETRVMDLVDGRKVTTLDVSASASPGDQGVSLSPDSRWMAFTGWASGQKEIFVQGFPAGTRTYQVSIGGGYAPLWSGDGREVFYRRGDAVFAVSIRAAEDGIVADRPRELFRGDFVQQYDPHEWSYDPSTDTLIMIRNGEHELSSDRFVVLMGWMGELRDGD